MAIKGSLSEAALPDVIQLITYSGKVGCLSVTDGKNFGNIFIKDGKVIYATILNRKQRLGHVLVAKKMLDEETMQRALELQKKEKKQKRFGEILLEMGALTKETLEQELKEQIQQTIYSMMTWESGYFTFEAGLLPSAAEYTVQLSTRELLLGGARTIDEWRKIEGKMPPFETVLLQKGTAEAISLTDKENKILGLVDGVRTIDDIVKISGLDFFETSRIIYGLLSAGLIEAQQKQAEVKQTKGDISEYKNLGYAFYKTEMYDEAEREYRKILEIESDNTEALFYLGLIELTRGHYERAHENLTKAAQHEKRASILNNLGYVCYHLRLFDEAIDCLKQAQELAPDNVKIRCNIGRAWYDKGALDESARIFREVIEKSPEIITPYMYLPLIYLKQGNSDGAMRLLRDAIDSFPRMTAFKNNLAILYEQTERLEDAEKLLRQALEMNPRDDVVNRNLADFYYNTQILGAAKELYEKIPDDKIDWQVLFRLGTIYLRQGDSQKALVFWERARELNPLEESITRNIETLRKSGGQ